jgi:mannosyltransferase OCH1-like enzyme
MIPTNIIQTYKTWDSIPDKYLEYINKLKELHPDYTYMLFDDNDIEIFMNTKYPQFRTLYDSFIYNIQRLDLFRILAVYEFGGFYFDIDVEITQSLDDLLNHNVIFPVEFNEEHVITFLKTNRLQYLLNKVKLQSLSDQLGQYAFASKRKHDFLEKFIYYIMNNPIPKNELTSSNKEEYVMSTTGPRLLTLAYMEYHNKNDIILLSPQEYKPHQFGDYGVHHMMGSWK